MPIVIGDVLNNTIAKGGRSKPTRHIGSTDGEFSVCQFFVSGEYEYVRRDVGIGEALEAFQHYTNNVAVRMGFVKKVIITDMGDCTCAVWTPEGGLELFDRPDQGD